MKIFYCGDIFGRPGREAVLQNINLIKENFRPDVMIVNAENSAHGFGSTPQICKEFIKKGIDVIVMGNHTFKQKELVSFLNESKQIIRPLNYTDNLPGKGFVEYETAGGKKILITQVLGKIHMYYNENTKNPAQSVDELLSNYTLGKNIDAIFVDVHAEITAEKQALGFYFDGRVSAVIGSHTHVPTADARILTNGTAYMTDVGMCGNYNSVIGSEPDVPIARMLESNNNGRLSVAEGKGTVCGVFIEINDKTGLAVSIKPVQIPEIK